IPQPTREQKLETLKRGLAEANRVGLTAVECAGGEGESSDFAVLDVLDQLRRDGALSLRFYVAYYLDPAKSLNEELPTLDAARSRYRDEWISTGAAKAYLDGVVEAHTAAMLTPYGDDPSISGSLFWDAAKYRSTVTELDRRGYQMFTHAIGDRAVRLALDSYEQAQQANGVHDARDRVEHIETISPADIPRFGKLRVIASFQPLHAYPDDDSLNVWARKAGPDRASRGWPWHSVAESGGRLAFGSDWPVVTMNPWQGLQNAVARQRLPEQRVTLEQAIEAYTLGAAFAGRRDKDEGSIEPGKLADIIMVSQDLFKTDPHQLRNTEVLLTMVGGKVVYESDAGKQTLRPRGSR
ncbi:MAG: amidohydrolase family protein, partial [Acidobacteria bacterium]|nr:amidohydrolase family protein [Acidobacteriota bacterium]